jgi:hypothetical protein
MDNVAGLLHILLVEKKQRIWFNTICLKFYPFKRIMRWCLFVMVSVMEVAMQSIMKFVTLEENIKKTHGLPRDHETLSIIHYKKPMFFVMSPKIVDVLLDINILEKKMKNTIMNRTL